MHPTSAYLSSEGSRARDCQGLFKQPCPLTHPGLTDLKRLKACSPLTNRQPPKQAGLEENGGDARQLLEKWAALVTSARPNKKAGGASGIASPTAAVTHGK
jgi:hypothetical protein